MEKPIPHKALASKCAIYLACALFSGTALSAPGTPATEAKGTPAPQQQAQQTLPAPIQEGAAGSYLSSQFARQNGDVDGAIRYLKDALSRNPNNRDLASQLLSMQVAKGDIASAIPTATKISALGGADPLADLLLTVALIKKQDYKAADKKLHEAFDASSGQLWLPLVEAWIDAGKGVLSEPLNIEEMPVTVGRAASVINYHLALINNHAGHTQAASANFADAVEDAESAPLRVMQQLNYFIKKHPEQAALKEFVKRFEDAHQEPMPPLETPVNTPLDGVAEVLFTMGNVMQMAGIRHDAAVYMQMARYLRPDFHLASYTLADVLIEGDAPERASDVLATIPSTSQYALKAKLRQSMILDKLGRSEEAMEVLNAQAAADAKAPDPWLAKGDLLRVHKRYLEATIAYSEAIRRIGKPAPHDWAVFYARGACYERLDRWREAEADLRKSLSLSPNQPDTLNYLGYSLLVRGQNVAEARSLLEKAIAASPNDPQIIDSMGWALYLIGEYRNALPYLERAVELLPNDATVNDHLGDIYWRLNRKTEARFQWERALTFKPPGDDAKKIEAKIASGLPPAQPLKAATRSASSAAAPDPIP